MKKIIGKAIWYTSEYLGITIGKYDYDYKVFGWMVGVKRYKKVG